MKKIRRVLSLLLSVILFCSGFAVNSSASDTETATQEDPVTYVLSVTQDEHMNITVSGENSPLSELEENKYSVIAGEKINVTLKTDTDYEVEGLYLGEETLVVNELNASFIMPERNSSLSGQTEIKIQNQEEKMDEKEHVTDDKQDGENSKAVGELPMDMLGRNRGIDMSSYQLGRTTTRNGTPNVGDRVTGTCYIYDTWMEGSQSYFNVGDFSGDLVDSYVTERIECLDHTAADPSNTMATYEATVTDVNTSAGYIEYSLYITPPGVTDGISRDENGNLYGYQHVGGKVRVTKEFVGSLDLYKASAKPEITNGNSAYSLKGAE